MPCLWLPVVSVVRQPGQGLRRSRTRGCRRRLPHRKQRHAVLQQQLASHNAARVHDHRLECSDGLASKRDIRA